MDSPYNRRKYKKNTKVTEIETHTPSENTKNKKSTKNKKKERSKRCFSVRKSRWKI